MILMVFPSIFIESTLIIVNYKERKLKHALCIHYLPYLIFAELQYHPNYQTIYTYCSLVFYCKLGVS